MKQKALGRGLDFLLGDDLDSLSEENSEAAVGDRVVEIPVSQIDTNPNQPRKVFDEEKLQQLAESIRSVGVIQPLTVCKNRNRYAIIAGERRWRAARLAGLSEIPCIVRSYDTIRQMEISLIENIQRDDLNPVEEAQAIQALMEECGLQQQQVAERVGKSRSAVANLLRILSLPPIVLQKVADGWLTEGHARALSSVKDVNLCIELATQVIEKGLTVRKTEALVELALREKKEPKFESAKPSLPEIAMLEDRVRRALGAKVSLQGTDKKGKITIQYFSREQLDAIYEFFAQGDE